MGYHSTYCDWLPVHIRQTKQCNGDLILENSSNEFPFRTSELPRTVPTHHSGACCRGKPSNSWPGDHPLKEPLPTGVNYRRYQPERDNKPNIHRWILDTETKYIRGEACATAAAQLKQQGFQPNLICAHPGWGESLFLSDEWTHTSILSYQEFFYRAERFDYDFDPKFSHGLLCREQKANIRIKISYMHLVLESSSWNITPHGIPAEQLAA